MFSHREEPSPSLTEGQSDSHMASQSAEVEEMTSTKDSLSDKTIAEGEQDAQTTQGNLYQPKTKSSADGSWKVTEEIVSYRHKHFNQTQSAEVREDTLEYLPRPELDDLFPPELDEGVKFFITHNLKDKLSRGALAQLYTAQKLTLEATGPLLCLWDNIANDPNFSAPDSLRII